MPTISTADRFLGSLLGTYIGHYYLAYHHGHWPPVRESPLYQSWLSSTKQPNISGPKSSEAGLTAAIPWLLHCHDDTVRRHHQLNQTLLTKLASAPLIAPDTEALYILGDCLEWLMQYTPDTQEPYPSLCDHLQQKSVTYPSIMIPQAHRLIEDLSTEALTNSPQDMSQDHTLSSITLAIRSCLSYPENLALSLANQRGGSCTAAMIGCLLGAWGGLSAIPLQWIMALTQDSRQSLQQIAQQLYRSWAGINAVATSFDAFPLDF